MKNGARAIDSDGGGKMKKEKETTERDEGLLKGDKGRNEEELSAERKMMCGREGKGGETQVR